MSTTKSRLFLVLLVLLLLAALLWPRHRDSRSRPAVPGAERVIATSQPPSPPARVAAAAQPAPAALPPAPTVPAGSNAPARAAATEPAPLSPEVLRQISALEAAKAKWTPAQQKLDSQLLAANRMERGLPVAEGVPTVRVDLDRDTQGRVVLDITGKVTEELLQYIQTLGGKVVNSFPQYQAIRAAVPLANIETLANRPEVRLVARAARCATNRVDSEGDVTHQAIAARANFGVSGAGMKVGVLSDSVDYLAGSQIDGLVTVLPGQAALGHTGEGTAMLEIVNDLAPGAQLYFATAEGGQAAFANNIQQLAAAGCNIIVDDVGYFAESPFQDDTVARAVNAVTASGVLYFSSAANSGNLTDGSSGTWEGDFVMGGLVSSGLVHSFGGSTYDTVTADGGYVDLFWADPLGASTNDYDLFLLNSSGTSVAAYSNTRQSGTQNPYEAISSPKAGERIVIVLYSGAGRFLHLDTQGGQLSVATSGATAGHSAATNAFSVAATPAAAAGGWTPAGPYPFAFNGANQVEAFSSDGPRRVFFQADGTPITPGNFSSTGGALRRKPDITAANGITTDVPSFAPFYGTSAAAPHAAAITALLKSFNPALTPAQMRYVLTNTAVDIMAAGWDRDSGLGIVMPEPALQSLNVDLTATGTIISSLSPQAGDTVTALMTLSNQAAAGPAGNAGPFHVQFYLSTNAALTGGTPLVEYSVTGLAATSSIPGYCTMQIPPLTLPGRYYLGCKVNNRNEVLELNTNNNTVAWAITVNPSSVPPLLSGGVYGNNIVLSWVAAGWQLAASTNLNGPWTTLYIPGNTLTNTFVVPINPNLRSQYFCLRSTYDPNLYSTNAFGYVTYPLVPTAANLLREPFLNGNNSVSTVLPSAQDGTSVTMGSAMAYYDATFGWLDPDTYLPSTLQINPGDSFWYQQGNPSTPLTLVLTGYVPVWIYCQPASQTVGLGAATGFAVGVNATAPVYQWHKNGTNLVNNSHVNGVTTSSLNLTTVSADDAGTYTLVVNSAYGSVTSAPAALTVLLPLTLTSQPTNLTLLAGSKAGFHVRAAGTLPLGYQWYCGGTALTNGGRISGATSPDLSIGALQLADAGNYSVAISSLGAVTNSAAATLTVISTNQVYFVTDLGTLGGTNSQAEALNDAGQVVGWALTTSGERHAFVYANGAMQDLGSPGTTSVANGINNLGDVVGQAGTSAFVDINGVMTSLNLPNSAATAINDARQVVGNYNPGTYYQGFLYQNGTILALGKTAGSTYNAASAINNAGQVAGHCRSSSYYPYHATLWNSATPDSVLDIGQPGIFSGGSSDANNNSVALGINDNGVIVGDAAVQADSYYAFLYANGHMTNLGAGGYVNSLAYDINNAGQVVGYVGTDILGAGGGTHYAYVWDASNGMRLLSSLVDASSSTWYFSEAAAINSKGQLAATGSLNGGNQHALLLTPVLSLVPPVRLNVPVLTNSTLALTWPSGPTGFRLQSANSLSGPWADLHPAMTDDGTKVSVTLPPSATNQFFRLVYP